MATRRIELSDSGAKTKFLDVLIKRRFPGPVLLESRGGRNGLQHTAYMTPQEALGLIDAIHLTLDEFAAGVMTDEEKALEHFKSLPTLTASDLVVGREYLFKNSDDIVLTATYLGGEDRGSYWFYRFELPDKSVGDVAGDRLPESVRQAAAAA
jgi:hypothetical protein